MFTNEEKFFLEAISKMLSNNNEERKVSEKNIQTWVKETYLQVLISCNKFITCEDLAPNIRQYSCYLIGLCTGKDHYQDWQNITLDLKTSVQNNALALLGNPIPIIRNQACIMVASIFNISVRDQGWPNLINILCSACGDNNIEFKLSAINTLGMIWEKLPREPFSNEELILMENALVNLLQNPQNEDLALKCLESYQYFIAYVKEKFTNINYIENSLKLLINYCNEINNINTNKVATEAIHRITQIILLSYDYVEKHFKNISEFLIQLAQGKGEDLAVQAFIFFMEISEDEINRKEYGLNYKKYIQSIWKILWDCIQFVLNLGQQDDTEEYNRYDVVKYLLINLSILCEESIIDDIFKYMGEKLNDNNPLKVSSAIYAFGALMETVHREKIASVIPSAINSISQLFSKNNDQLSKTLSWCYIRICQYHSFLIIQNNNIFSFLISTILTLLKEQSLPNQVKMNLCGSIYSLTQYIINQGYQSYNLFSPFLQDLLTVLEALAYLPSSYDTNNNLSEKSFIALSSLIECTDEKDKLLIAYFMEKIFERLKEAQDINKFGGNKDKIYFFQSMLCLCVQGLCKNSKENIIQLNYQSIEGYFNLIDNFFKIRSNIFEEGLMALSSLITLLPQNQIDALLQRIMVYIKYALTNFSDSQNCSNACLCLLNIIESSKEKFYPYLGEIFPLFNKIISEGEENISKKNILTLITVVYSDMFEYVGEKMWEYHEQPLTFMEQILDFAKEKNVEYLSGKNNIDPDEMNYFIKLNENVVDLIQNIAGYLTKCNEDIKEMFKNYMPNIIEYLITMMENQMFNPSNDYLDSCLSFLSDFADIYKNYLFRRINDYTFQRLFQFANNSEDDNIIHLRDNLQNLIYKNKLPK